MKLAIASLFIAGASWAQDYEVAPISYYGMTVTNIWTVTVAPTSTGREISCAFIHKENGKVYSSVVAPTANLATTIEFPFHPIVGSDLGRFVCVYNDAPSE
jgi:hypothetical protein